MKKLCQMPGAWTRFDYGAPQPFAVKSNGFPAKWKRLLLAPLIINRGGEKESRRSYW